MDDSADRADEAYLTRAACAGDDGAWRVLYLRHIDGVYGFVVHRLGANRDLADEIVQETWLTAARRIGDFDPARGAFGAWVRGIAFRILANAFRTGQRATAAHRAIKADNDGRREEASVERADHMAITLTALPDRYRSVLEQKYRDGLTMQEIAEASGASIKAVESLLTRARDAFRTEFARHAEPAPSHDDEQQGITQ